MVLAIHDEGQVMAGDHPVRPDAFLHKRFSRKELIGVSVSCETARFKDPLTPQEREWLMQHDGKITLSVETNYAPFAFVDENGISRGLATEYIDLIEKRLKFRFKKVTAGSLNEILIKAQQKEIDVVNAVTKTPKRSEYLLFTEPVIEIPNVIIVRKEQKEPLTLDTMKNMKVSLVKDYAITEFIEKNYEKLDVDFVPDDLTALLKVSFGITKLYRLDDRQVIESGHPKLLIEEPQTTPEGNTITLLTSKMPLRNTTGGIIGVLGTYMDITERKRAEEALRESEEKYRQFVETANEGVWAMDGDRRTTFVNRRMTEMLGYTPQEMLGKTVEKFMFDEDLADHQAKMAQRKKGHGGAYERRFRHKGGGGVWTQVSATAVIDEQGRFSGSHALFTDITDRKQAEQALIDSQNNLKSFFNAIPESVFLMDINGTVLAVNATTVNRLGKPPHEILGKSIYDFIPDRVGDYRKQVVEKVIQTKKPATFEDERLGRYFYNNVSPVLNEFGRVVRLAVVGIDITERKQNEERLKQAQKLESIGTLAGGIAHDFNNILYPLLGFAELLKEDIPADSPLQDHIDEILNATMRSKNLVQQILAFSRKGDQSAKPIKLQPIVKEALKLLRSSIPTTIDIQQDIDSDCGVVMADPTQIHQIVMNLATNAYHAMEDTGGRLTVSLKQIELVSESAPSVFQKLSPGNYVLLTVSDTGIGIAKDILDKIFEPYFTTKGVGKGTGLGLSVVHGILKTYKGDVQIYSEPGKGTRIHVYLPILEQAVEDIRIEDSEPIPGGAEKILLVDDEEVIVRVEKQMLERLGYQVTARTSSLEALATFKANPQGFDLVITDMNMPKMTGVQLAEELNSIRSIIPIIVCTGFSDKIDEKKATAKGIKSFLMKPVNKSNMAQVVRKVLDEGMG